MTRLDIALCLFNLYAEYIMWNARLDESQAGIKIARRNINNLKICRRYHSNGRKWRGTKEPLDESKRGEWKNWLKTQHLKNEDHGIWSHHFMANRWKTMETLSDFIFLGPKISADGDCSHEIKRRLILGRKPVMNLDNRLKSKDITFLTKLHVGQSYDFSNSHTDVRVGP